ncbi:PDZ domain-containing protein [Pseudomonas sp. NFACC13-1]|uniref:PDZ domain-containing protein n=1 Tax=Pseudomonas sp. NFACC13-1 TaxID=1566245 RepID=UPI00115F83D6|nr:PDZ domain-containing protein [Pseudomonas sp. NFACC13-1]
MNKAVRFAALSLVVVNLSGCVVEMVTGSIAEASFASETPESVGLAPANFRGQSCPELALQREHAESSISYTGEHADYVQKHGRWRLASVEQVEREQGCLAGTTFDQAATVDYVAKHPEAAKELESRLPPSARSRSSDGTGTQPSANSHQPGVTAPQPKASTVSPPPSIGSGFGSTSLVSGLPQTSFAQLLAQETPEKYKGKSCEYLRLAYVRSEELLAADSPERRALGAGKKTAISQILNGRDCPPLSTAGHGRIGAAISSIDPVKAARLGMPLKGTSVEKIMPNGNAEKAGLRFADVIVSIDAISVDDDIDFLVAMGKMPIGSNMLLKVWRKDGFIDIPVLIGPPT